ncbi:MAG: hypothetical protein GY838_08175 [bacterium]|nr:hypothetical protein [bacterium]
MTTRTVLLTSHKGVDLHAATAVRVMKDRLAGGDRLAALHRCEFHVLADGTAGWSAERLLDTGRFFNPNKHHYGIFAHAGDGAGKDTGRPLPADWPGEIRSTDLETLAGDATGLYDHLLGGAVAAGYTAVDVAAWSRDSAGPVTSGVLWRLVLRAQPEEAGALAETLAVARTRKEGMLLNPHMEAWRTAVRPGPGRETP